MRVMLAGILADTPPRPGKFRPGCVRPHAPHHTRNFPHGDFWRWAGRPTRRPGWFRCSQR
nr:MAG TPA: hypothetical protein [Bacteriophage sp.]